MAAISRRSLARYAVDQLVARQSVKKISASLAAALIENKMAKQVDLVVADIDEELESRGLVARAVITSAHALSAQLKTRLASELKAAAKVDEVAMVEYIDPAIIGGFRIETARHTWDHTIARQLQDIKGGISPAKLSGDRVN